mgnify:CR=1 FL=1
MEAIKTIGLTKKYKDLIAVDDLNLEVGHGELFSLLGINGAGKTTTIKMLSCLIKSTSGDAFIEGNSIIKDGLKVKGIIGVSPQESAVAESLSVKENLELMCGIYSFNKQKRISKSNELISQFGLESVMNKRASKLSGGYKRRLSIALALISEPEILFLDEPTLGLDVLARQELWELIRSPKGTITIILTTHYMEEAAEAQRVVVMSDGKIIMDDVPKKIFSRIEEMKAHSLDVPQSTELMHELRKCGIDVSDEVLNEEEALAVLRQLVTILPACYDDDASFDECEDDLNRIIPEMDNYAHDARMVFAEVSDNNLFIELKKDYAKEVLAYLFHKAVANAIVTIADKICREQGTNQVALSGGTFINRILLTEVIKGLEAKEKNVYINEKVPCGDGGIALGQMYLATFSS